VIIEPTPLPGAVLIRPERLGDERGHFARTYCRRELAAAGLDFEVAQASVSFNRRRGTLRGMHFQAEPHPEIKLVRCTRGALFDVIIDLRPESPTFRRWFGAELTEENGDALYVPAGFAHGFITLADETEVSYFISAFYEPALARAVRWDDPAFGIAWPLAPVVMSDRDRSVADFRPDASR